MAIEEPSVIKLPAGPQMGKHTITCLRCGNVYGVEFAPLKDWEQHGLKAFDKDKRN